MKRHLIEFVCSAPGFRIENRKSAVGSMVRCALESMSDRFEIRANGQQIGLPGDPGDTESRAAAGTAASPALTMARLLTPRILKSAAREFVRERERTVLERELRGLSPKPSVVFELYSYGSIVGHRLAVARGVPLVLYCDAPEVVPYAEINGITPPQSRRAAERERTSVRAAEAIIAYSEVVKRYLVDHYGADHARIRVFQTLDHSRMSGPAPRASEGVPTIGYVGSFMHWHRIPGLIEAFDRVRAAGLPARLLLVGSGVAKEAVLKRVGRSPFRADIDMPGFLDGPALAAAKAMIDVAVLPGTRWYNLPTKVFEYGAAATATVAPRSPTVESLFRDGQDLLLFREGDIDELTDALRTLAGDAGRRSRIAASLADVVRTRHSAAATRDFYVRLFEEVTASSVRPRTRE